MYRAETKVIKVRRIPRCLALTALVVVSIWLTTGAFAAEQKTADAPKPTAPAPPLAPPSADIPLADIAARATEASNLISSLTTAAVPAAQIETITKSLPHLSEKINAQLTATTTTLESEPTLETLQALQQQWQREQMETSALLSTLTQQATKVQDGLNQLDDLQKTWTNTLASAEKSKAPDPILQQIDATLTAIAAAQEKIQAERSTVLDLQSRVAQEVTKCGAALAQIGQYQQKAVAGIFVPDSEPIWRTEPWFEAIAALPDHVRKVGLANWSDIVRYIRAPREGAAVHAAAFIVLASLFAAARRKLDDWKKSGPPALPALQVFERPYAAALATVLVYATSPFFQIPTSARQLLTIIALVPLMRLVQPVVTSVVVSGLYALALLFAVETLRQAFGGIRFVGQIILVAETLAAILVLIWLRGRYQRLIAEQAQSSQLILFKLTRYLITILLITSLLAGAAGYVRLARLLTPGILVGGILALVSVAFLRVGAGVVAVTFRLWPLRSLQMVEHHRELLARRIYAFLVWAAVLGWGTRYLAYLGLLDPTWAYVESVLTGKIERGTISITIGSVVEFFLVVFAAYMLSRFIRFALQEDVYPRIDLAPGLSYAVSSLLNYIVLALGFIAGFGLLGVDFSKVSILAGAFGVGIGFGLQSIVNNFVSGLILLFERPIHVGDIVEVGNLQGTVRRIGIRASVIHTGAGADIIVPNSQLVTDKVTNWTLSDRLRRVDLPVGVNYGADPKKVIELLQQVARAHADVLREPAPRALFMGYGDSSINFELRVWPSQFNQAAQVKSDLAAAVYTAVNAAGMSFPFPQREVRILSDHASEPTAAPTTAGDKKA
jgi:small-conductance mechanosensitive channel